MANNNISSVTIKNIAMECTNIVWVPNNLISSSWMEILLLFFQGLGSIVVCFFCFLLSNSTVTFIHSLFRTKMGLVLWTRVDTLVAGDLGKRVNLAVVILHLLICSKLTRPWYIVWNWSSGHSTNEFVGCWKNRKLNDPKLYRTRGSATYKEHSVVWL